MKLHSFLLAIGLCIVAPSMVMLAQDAPTLAIPEPELSQAEKEAAQRAAFAQFEQKEAAALERAQEAQRQAQATYNLLSSVMGSTIGKEEKRLFEQRRKETENAVQNTPILRNKSLPTATNRAEWINAFVSVYEGAYADPGALQDPVKAQKQRERWATDLNTLFENLNIEKLGEVGSTDAIEISYNNLSSRLKIALAERLAALEPQMKRLESELRDLNVKIIEEERKLKKARKENDPITIQTAQESLAILRNKSGKVAQQIANSALAIGVSTAGMKAMQGARTYAGEGLEIGLALIPTPVKAVISGSVAAAKQAFEMGKYISSGQASEDAKRKIVKTVVQAARATQRAIDWTSETAEAAKQRVVDTVAQAKETTKKAIDWTSEAATTAATTAVGAGTGAAGWVASKAVGTYTAGQEAATAAVQKGREAAGWVGEKATGAYTASAEALERVAGMFKAAELTTEELEQAKKELAERKRIASLKPEDFSGPMLSLESLEKNKSFFEAQLAQAKKAANTKEIARIESLLTDVKRDIALLQHEKEQRDTKALLTKAKEENKTEQIAALEIILKGIEGRIDFIQQQKQEKDRERRAKEIL